MTTTERKLVMIARLLGRGGEGGRLSDGGALLVRTSCTSDDFNLVGEIRAVLLEERGVKVRRCEDCDSVAHDTGTSICPQFEWARS